MPPAPGARLGPYEIVALLGAGGMGEVYRARDVRLGRQVALKLLPERVGGDRETLDRFLQEARAASSLSHPNICTIFDVGEQDGRPFLVMELLEGQPLDRLLAAGPLALDRLLDLAGEIADAVETAHAAGILHRDLKPANLFVTERGAAKVLDFGLAKLARAGGGAAGAGVPTAAALTVPGTSLGTVGYMAPEQALGREVDARSDVFSLGAVLYEMAAGRQAFPGDTAAAVYDAILHSTPAPLAELRRDLPPELVSVIERALAKDPAARYPGVAALRAALAAVPVPAGASGTAEPPSIAVLPFANMSADPENEYFTDGMAEEIINSLCKIEALRVASRTSSFAFKGKLEDIRKIGRTLGVSTVLEGSVRKIGQRLRITAQLVKVDDGYHLWSERFDRNLEDVFAVQDEIAESIAAVLRVLLSAREQQAIRKIPTRSVEAYDFYLRGLAYVRLIREDSLRLGEQMFRRAVELDPEFALAWAGIAESCAWRYTWFEPRPEVRATADEASRKVLALDPQLAEGHVARGQAATLFNDHALAAREFETASRIDPRLWGAYYFHARTCMNVGRLEEAARLFRRAIEVRPDDYQAPSLLNSCLLGLGRLEERKEVAARAIRVIEKHVQLHPDDVRAVYFGAGEWSALGEREKALEWARRALDMVPGDPGVRYNVACILVAEGQHDEALDLLERNVAVGWGNAEWVRNDPDWTPLRDHPRFRDLVARMPARGTV